MVEKVRLTQLERREQSRKKLHKALIDIINEEGIHAATCEKIGQKAGVSRGLASQRLGKRSDMFHGLVEQLVIEKKAKIEALQLDKLSSVDALKRYIDMHFDEFENNEAYRAYFVLYLGSITDSELLGHSVRPALAFTRILLSNLMQRGIDNKELRSDTDAVFQAAKLGSYLTGVIVQSFHLQGELKAIFTPEKFKQGAYELVEYLQV